MKILLLEDDALLGESLKEYLEEENFEIDWVQDGEAVFDITFENNYDLYILDINVPLINGFDLLSELRTADDTTPVIYISALCDVESITKGFTVGAEEYIKKPFDPEELVLRIRHRFVKGSTRVSYGTLSIEPQTGVVKMGDTVINLGNVQKNILLALLENPGSVVAPEKLFEHLRKPSYNALRATLSKLKKRLPINIQNIRGEGYMVEKL